MDIQITGRKITVGESLSDHIRYRLEEGASKYFARSINAQVTISKVGHNFRVDCSLHANKGMTMQSHAEASDVYVAFDDAADKIEKQLRRYKRRIKNHHNEHEDPFEVAQAQAYVLKPEEESEEDSALGADEDNPIIIAEANTDIPKVSVGDAVMLMDLRHVSALMFKNIKTGGLNVVYKRADGNIGWIDPGN